MKKADVIETLQKLIELPEESDKRKDLYRKYIAQLNESTDGEKTREILKLLGRDVAGIMRWSEFNEEQEKYLNKIIWL